MTFYNSSDDIDLLVNDQGELKGTSGTGFPDKVKIRYNGSDWATVPSEAADGSENRMFRCGLPPVTLDGVADEIAAVVDERGNTLASTQVVGRKSQRNAWGVEASAVRAIHDRPFFAVPYMSFDGAKILITGAHLPPEGDPSALGVQFGPGVSYEFQFPLESPDWERHFWYWPNARLSNFMLTIDLAASGPESDPFTFRFTYAKGSQKDLPEPYGRVWIPRDLRSVVGMPSDPNQLTRVQTWSDSRSVTLTGFNAFCVIRELLQRYGVGETGTTLMDWGCGHGRVTRHFVREWPKATVIGMDVDVENVEWAAQNIKGGTFVASPLLPPCDLSDGCLDALFSISVMTHLTFDTQLLWLAELARLIRPGGIALMSFGGPGAVAWSSVWNGPEYFKQWQRDGIHADCLDPALDGKIPDSTYYRNTAQTHEHVRTHWSKHFEVVDIVSEAIGNLDFAVLRRRKRPVPKRGMK